MTVPVTTSSSPNQPATSSNTPATAANGQQEPESPAPTEGDDHPELDDFVKGFYDGGGFSDVDNRVWVTST
ncbi:hypothetical protein CPC16_009648 [Podila verticillata]|nr:hypothetical protein BGZ52_003004 [Haplosporangium bisporale]KAF9210735.1 hypothetical protein BGZ59_009045 [Podila verticillata]KAF9381857.1 hypothetical protein CPC16_009648 [Podila verticillata]KFH71251.1 hypothetical protein MVEG_01552 [Podila verticillata NRRL 6337]